MEITLREDLDPDIDFYYQYQFKIYHEPYLIWDRHTWKTVLATCTVYRIEVDGKYAGDVLLEGRGRGTKSIVDFSILPEYQGKGIGKDVLEQVKKYKTYRRHSEGNAQFFLEIRVCSKEEDEKLL
jgi:GNAT superfamily N-acetyltransferase